MTLGTKHKHIRVLIKKFHQNTVKSKSIHAFKIYLHRWEAKETTQQVKCQDDLSSKPKIHTKKWGAVAHTCDLSKCKR